MGVRLKKFHKPVNRWPRNHSDSLEKIVAAFCSCPKKSLPKAKLKGFRLMALAEISRQPSIDCMCRVVIGDHSYADL